MAVTSNMFQSALDNFIKGNANFKSGGDTIKMALLTSSASPNLSTWAHYSDLTNEVASGGGYTTGGATLGSLTNTETAASSWGTAWATSQTWTAGQIIKPLTATSPDYLQLCVVGGAGSASTEPTWKTVPGNTVVDSSATWSCLGESITVYSSASATWTSSTISAQYGVIYDSQSGTGSTEPLICLINFGTTESDSSGTFTVSPDSTLGWFWTSPA